MRKPAHDFIGIAKENKVNLRTLINFYRVSHDMPDAIDNARRIKNGGRFKHKPKHHLSL